MPTASGNLTAEEKRQQRDARFFIALREIASRITTPEWLAEQVIAYKASARHAYDGPQGEMLGYEISFPAGEIYPIGREKIDEGRARALAVADRLRIEGWNPHTMTSFGLFAGRSSVAYNVTEYRLNVPS